MARHLLAPALVLLLGAPPVQGAEAPGAAAPSLEALAAGLTQAVMPLASGDTCEIRLVRPGLAPIAAGCDEPGAAGAASAGGTDVSLVASAQVPTPRWGADLAPLGDGRMARVHGYGDVAAHDPDGEVAWARSGLSFYDDWGIEPWIVPIVAMGASPIDPLVVASERPFATGDLTHDGTPDVAVGHYVRLVEPDGETTSGRSFVTIVDGADGDTRWWQEYPGYITQLLVVGDRLLVGNETGNVKATEMVGRSGSTTSLTSLAFDTGGEGLEATEAWRFDTGAQWARLLALEPAGDAGYALGYTSKALGASGSGGRVRYSPDGSGAAAWEVTTSGYPRAIRYDGVRDRVVVHEQADPIADSNGRQSYWITGLAAETGAIAARISRAGAVLTSFAVADVTAGPEPEWLTGDLQQLPQTPAGGGAGTYQAMRVIAADGANPTNLWTHSVQMPSEFLAGRGPGAASWPVPYAITAGGPQGARRVVVATLHGFGDGLRGLAGSDGSLEWERYGSQTFPLFLTPRTVQGEPAVLAVSRNQVFRAFAVDDGAPLLEVPLLADTYAAVDVDVDADGTSDLIVGGESGAVFALDGGALDDDPRQLWRTAVGSGVRKLSLVDLDADGDDELVAAATSGVAALDPITGAELWRVALPGRYVWTFEVGELDGQPGLDVLVPERTLLALRGSTGAVLWEHEPDTTQYFSNAVITPEGIVVAQALVEFPYPLAPRHHRLMVGLDARTGAVAWRTPEISRFANGRLWHSVTTAGRTADGAGTRVALTWEPGGGPVGTADSGITTTVIDARDGGTIVGHPPEDQGVVPMATIFEPGRGLFEVNWKTVQQMEPQSAEIVWEATSDIAWADFGEHGEMFLRAWHRVWAHEPDAPSGAVGTDHPAPLAEYRDLFSGAISVTDLDADGEDEVIALPFDWPGYAQVAAWAGIGVLESDLLPHGIAVLEAM
ncbi:MAG TPA: PQQ-binding-like beta-propeller repeat protein [Actinomycetota bacterium]